MAGGAHAHAHDGAGAHDGAHAGAHDGAHVLGEHGHVSAANGELPKPRAAQLGAEQTLGGGGLRRAVEQREANARRERGAPSMHLRRQTHQPTRAIEGEGLGRPSCEACDRPGRRHGHCGAGVREDMHLAVRAERHMERRARAHLDEPRPHRRLEKYTRLDGGCSSSGRPPTAAAAAVGIGA
jgi:hypothetical protein